MNCQRCGSANPANEHHCGHCGHWLGSPAPVYRVGGSSAVPVPHELAEPPADSPAHPTPTSPPPRQASLFGAERKVIPFDSIGGGGRGRGPRDRNPGGGHRRPGRPGGNQATLDLRPLATRQQVVYHDEAHIARPNVRLKAALLDLGFCAIGIAMAAAAFYFMAGPFPRTQTAGLFYGGVAVSIVVFYHLFWSVLGRDTTGMRVYGLRLLTFDGSNPRWTKRVVRFAATCLSISAGCIGLIWALADSEGLAWQDLISQTFPSVHDKNPGTFHRKALN